MDVHLTPEAERIVNHKVATGEYSSPDAVMAEALRLLDARDHVKEDVRNKIAEGMASLRAGRHSDGEIFMAELMKDLDDADEAQ